MNQWIQISIETLPAIGHTRITYQKTTTKAGLGPSVVREQGKETLNNYKTTNFQASDFPIRVVQQLFWN